MWNTVKTRVATNRCMKRHFSIFRWMRPPLSEADLPVWARTRLEERKEQLDNLAKEKSELFALLSKDKDGFFNEKDQLLRLIEAEKLEKRDIAQEKQKQVDELKLQLLKTESMYEAIVSNRALIEVGIRKMTSSGTMTQRWKKFFDTHIVNSQGKFQDKARKLFEQLNSHSDEKSIVKELKEFIHQLSKPHHRPMTASGRGLVCGEFMKLTCLYRYQ